MVVGRWGGERGHPFGTGPAAERVINPPKPGKSQHPPLTVLHLPLGCRVDPRACTSSGSSGCTLCEVPLPLLSTHTEDPSQYMQLTTATLAKVVDLLRLGTHLTSSPAGFPSIALSFPALSHLHLKVGRRSCCNVANWSSIATSLTLCAAQLQLTAASPRACSRRSSRYHHLGDRQGTPGPDLKFPPEGDSEDPYEWPG